MCYNVLRIPKIENDYIYIQEQTKPKGNTDIDEYLERKENEKNEMHSM